MNLTSEQQSLLRALGDGWTLKSHRDLDGSKVYQLHSVADELPRTVGWETVAALRERGLIDSNKKFPAATYLLTDRGREALTALGGSEDELPLTATGWN